VYLDEARALQERHAAEVGPPAHVIEALAESAARPDVHGYAPFAGLPALKEAIAARYADVYGVELDPKREVAVLPGTKTGLMEFALCAVERGGTIVLPDPGYPDYFSAVALAGARVASFSGFDMSGDAMYLNFPTNPTATAAPDGVFEETIEWSRRNDAWVMHDFAYGDLVFDGRAPRSFLAADGARDVGIELFSMSKSYGMAGWRLGFALGNAELVRRIENLQDHAFAGIFRPVQEAGIAALTGPQGSVEDRRAAYEPPTAGRGERVDAGLISGDANAADRAELLGCGRHVGGRARLQQLAEHLLDAVEHRERRPWTSSGRPHLGTAIRNPMARAHG